MPDISNEELLEKLKESFQVPKSDIESKIEVNLRNTKSTFTLASDRFSDHQVQII